MFLRATKTHSKAGRPAFSVRLVQSERHGSSVRQKTLLNPATAYPVPEPLWHQVAPEAARIARAAGLQPRLYRRRMRTGKLETSQTVVLSEAQTQDGQPPLKCIGALEADRALRPEMPVFCLLLCPQGCSGGLDSIFKTLAALPLTPPSQGDPRSPRTAERHQVTNLGWDEAEHGALNQGRVHDERQRVSSCPRGPHQHSSASATSVSSTATTIWRRSCRRISGRRSSAGW